MKSNKLLLSASLLALLSLSGCGEKSIEYYAANQPEAIEVILKCQTKGPAMYNDKNCTNAVQGNAVAVRNKTLATRKAEKESLKQLQAEVDAANKK